MKHPRIAVFLRLLAVAWALLLLVSCTVIPTEHGRFVSAGTDFDTFESGPSGVKLSGLRQGETTRHIADKVQAGFRDYSIRKCIDNTISVIGASDVANTAAEVDLATVAAQVGN